MISIAITVGLAFAGYVVTYLNGLRLAQRQARLDRVNRQLSDLYGPLFALMESNLRTYAAYLSRHAGPDGRSPFRQPAPAEPPSAEALAEWRIWATTAFIPNIRLMRDVIINKADLILDEKMPPVLLDLCAHAYSYEIVAGRWEAGDYSERTSDVPWPGDELRIYIESRFSYLKEEQARLLGTGEARIAPGGKASAVSGPRKPHAQVHDSPFGHIFCLVKTLLATLQRKEGGRPSRRAG